ncbi:MAG: hypothetical protein IJW48_02015 [Clostridia bacterium]|nr:hypothetical protein [Clostridia bacterium]
MSKSQSSLEKFLENYIKNKKITNSEDSFDEYRAKNAEDYGAEFSRGVEDAYVEAMKARADYGRNAEAIFSSGLSRSGYAERQRELSGETYEKRIAELIDKRNLAEARTVLGYADYLEDYNREQSSLMKSVRAELIKNGIINTERAYEYALGAGLSDERALEVSVGIYSAVKDKIIADLIEKVITFRLDAESAAELAKKYGLDEGDTAYVKSEAEKLLGKEYEASHDALRELEEEADRTTSSFK